MYDFRAGPVTRRLEGETHCVLRDCSRRIDVPKVTLRDATKSLDFAQDEYRFGLSALSH